MSETPTGVRVRRAGDLGLLLEAPDLAHAMSLEAQLRSNELRGVVDIVCGARTVLLTFADRHACETALPVVRAVRAEPVAPPPASRTEIGVLYDGEDLAPTAALLGMSAEALVSAHGAAPWSVAFGGFAPGFAYLVRADWRFEVPRLDSPRARVPAGSVALAGAYSGVYPRDSSGGWRLLGRTAAVLWEPTRAEPALLRPGGEVRFVPQHEAILVAPLAPPATLASHVREALLVVESVGLQALFEDEGRPGGGSLGVPSSGALDRAAMRAANRAVGNRAGAVVIEAAGGIALRAERELVMAVTGAEAPVEVRSTGGAPRAVGLGTPVAIHVGETLRVGAPTRGLRNCVAVRGGFEASTVLGSGSTDLHSVTGPAPIAAGDVLSVGSAVVASVQTVEVAASSIGRRRSPDDAVTVRVRLGPRDDWFGADAIHRFLQQEWRVSPQASRVGIRLLGDALTRARSEELASEGMVLGAVQVPPNGQPVVFLADHPPTGGYPVIAVVADADIDLLAQLRPGDGLRFTTDLNAGSEKEN